MADNPIRADGNRDGNCRRPGRPYRGQAVSARSGFGSGGSGKFRAAIVDLLAVQGDGFRRGDAQADLIAPDGDDRYPDAFVDDNGFSNTTGQYEHDNPP